MAIRTTLIDIQEKHKKILILKDWVQEMKFDRMGCFAYSHEENTHAYLLEDDGQCKTRSCNEIMELQSQISWDLNQEKIRQTFQMYYR
jgi:ribosomal protein S12 methylthiotransferase